LESLDLRKDFDVSEQLKATVDTFQTYYQNSKDAERDVANLIKLEVEEMRFARSASRAAAVAQQLEAKQRARAAGTNALIEGQRRRAGGF
jgi:hypothetical protein